MALLGIVGLLRTGYIGGTPGDDDVALPQSFLDAKVFPTYLNGKVTYTNMYSC